MRNANSPINNVIPFRTQGTVAYKNTSDVEKKTSNDISFSIPDGHKATIIIENSSAKGIKKNLFINDSIEPGFSFESNNNDKEIINKIYIDKIKEEEAMKREIINEIHIKQVKFLLLSVSLTVLSLVGFILFLSLDFVFINPALYILLFIMGIGWGTTAVASIFRGR